MSLIYTSDGSVRCPFSLLLGDLLPSRPTPHPTERMRAAAYGEHGPVDAVVVAEVPLPVPAPGQVLVRVAGAGVHPVDVKLRAHRLPDIYFPKPKIPGTDFSGTVVDASKGGGRFEEGDPVFGMLPLLGATWGSAAEYVAVDERAIARAPSSIPLEDAAALPTPALAVLQALRAVEAEAGGSRKLKGRWALVQAGAGSVGSFAVQYLANHLGMRVVATCSGANLEFVRGLGAEVAIDYTAERFEERLGKGQVAVVIDPLGDVYEARTFKAGILAPGAHYVHMAAAPWGYAARAAGPLHLSTPEARPDRVAWGLAKAAASRAFWRFRYHYVAVRPDAEGLGRVALLVDSGEARPQIQQALPLGGVRAAHLLIEGGHTRGSIVLAMDEAAAGRGRWSAEKEAQARRSRVSGGG